MHSHHIIVKKAREHNLQNVDLELNSNELIVFTGLSGSGKSSMAFDTLYVEGQRRYIQSLPPSARRILEQVKKPDVDEVWGLSPTICIAQKSISKNPRSTVGTITEIHDYLRLLFARVGIAYCPISGERVTPQSKESIVKVILEKEKEQILILSPIAQGKKGAFKEELFGFMQRGYLKARIDGHMVSLDEEFTLDKNKTHDIDLVIDRVTINNESRARIVEAITTALELSRGMLIILNQTTQQEHFYSTFGFSKKSKQFYPPLEPHDFSFNSPLGMCPSCYGLGVYEDKLCPTCTGKRIRDYPAATQFCGKTIIEITAMTIEEAHNFLQKTSLNKNEQAIAEEVLKELLERLSFLLDVGLSYLTLDRPAPTLSGGEAQRVHLASHVGSGLVGITYILDEPSIGLHPRDNLKLIKTLIRLKELGNTVIVVEHDEETILAADRIVDFGPKAGRHGGHILVNGTLEALIHSSRSLTGAYISQRRFIEIPQRRQINKDRQIVLSGATLHNLKQVQLVLPLGCMIAVTGVSGSGKSSLISHTLAPALSNTLGQEQKECGPFTKLEGADFIDKMIIIDQSPIGRTPRSNPATYMKIFDEIRTLFSELPAARAKGFSSGRFSFNVREGSCSKCAGLGMTKIDMDFMEDTWLVCDLCEGKRFDAQTLSILYKGKSIHDILQMTIEEALEFFENFPTLKRKLELICQVGLAYLTLGQSSTTLSGGEAQRMKLAKELLRPDTRNTFYILDEPTTGLHFHDIHTLLRICHTLVDRGNTLLIIEHNMDVVKVCDHVIDLGPEAGVYGGEILAQATPEEIAQLSSPTGEALAAVLNRKPPSLFKKQEVLPKKEDMFIENAHENNLKYVTVSLPKNKLICITGPSGSGKTSFAFDTLYAEGNRRYTETLSAYARQFVHVSHRPKCSRMEGLQASIAIEPRNQSSNPRSTLGTLTEIYDYLRLLYLHMGIPYCPETGEKIESINKEFVVKQLLSYPKEEKITILAPLKLRKQDSFEALVEQLRAQGFLRMEINGILYDLDSPISFNERNKNSIAVLIDRIKLSEKEKSRLTEAIETALRLSKDQILVQREGKEPELFNLAFAVIKTGKSYPTLTPQSFSFNHIEGMCLVCEGKGGTCPECQGTRLNALARNVEVAGKTLFTICEYSLTELRAFFSTLHFPPLLQEVQEQIEARLGFLLEVGLGYLSLSRTIGSLSNGEAQRVRLARQLGSNLRGVLYILDEPTVGLHPRDIEGLNTICKKLKELGNTLILVEHDPMTLAIADHLIVFGPKAGKEGGTITFEGSLEHYTLPSLSFSHAASPPQEMFIIKGAHLHNLKNITVHLPLSRLTTLTGVSGSGKSTLMHEVIYPYVKDLIKKKEGPFAEVIVIDQNPIHLTPRSDISSYTDLLIHLRTFYASLPLARARGLLPQHFSHNHKRGMCTHCQGLGYVIIDMMFFPTIHQPCDRCGGLRLNPVSLDITYQGLNLGQLLQRPIAEVAALFEFLPKAKRILDILLSCGLGYLPLSQQILTLSTGEAQRIKLCAELSKTKAVQTLYLFDEPSTGLALSDIDILLRLLYRLVEKGNTVLVIEHTMEFIQCSDYIIELGPVAGDEGGYLIAEGNVESLKRNPNSVTGKYLN